MKIPSIKNRIRIILANHRIEKENKFLNNYINIHNNTTYGDSFQQMNTARKTIANYAQEKGVTIDIYDARKELCEHDSPIMEDYLSDKLSIHVTDLLTNQQEQRIISARTDITHPHIEVIESPANGTQAAHVTRLEYQDNFLRHLYRNIENMVNTLQSRK